MTRPSEFDTDMGKPMGKPTIHVYMAIRSVRNELGERPPILMIQTVILRSTRGPASFTAPAPRAAAAAAAARPREASQPIARALSATASSKLQLLVGLQYV